MLLAAHWMLMTLTSMIDPEFTVAVAVITFPAIFIHVTLIVY